MILARMQLHEAGDVRCLAGHSDDTETVLVLRKESSDRYTLHAIPITEADQALRSLLAADQAEAGELCQAILATNSKPVRKPRKRKAKR